jgi:hypothetical protein
MGIEFVGRQGIFAACEGEFVCREETQQQTLLPANRAVATHHLRRSSASSLNVTAPQWRDAKLKPRRALPILFSPIPPR